MLYAEQVDKTFEKATEIKNGGLNCWVVKQCGRKAGQPIGYDRLFCPIPVKRNPENPLSGDYSGKTCWKMKNALCKKELVNSGVSVDIGDCENCEVYRSHMMQ